MLRGVVVYVGVGLLSGCLPSSDSEGSSDADVVVLGADGGDASPTVDGGAESPMADSGVAADAGMCAFPTSQAASEPCCPAHGVDACGAGLFCAAFDGRMQPTCYIEGVRQNGETCGADPHCLSGACHPDLEVCRPTQGEDCAPEVGCAPRSDEGHHLYCAENGRCRASRGDEGDPCAEDRDCDAGRCSRGVCVQPTPCEAACSTWVECAVVECDGFTDPASQTNLFEGCLGQCSHAPIVPLVEGHGDDCVGLIEMFSQMSAAFAADCRGR